MSTCKCEQKIQTAVKQEHTWCFQGEVGNVSVAGMGWMKGKIVRGGVREVTGDQIMYSLMQTKHIRNCGFYYERMRNPWELWANTYHDLKHPLSGCSFRVVTVKSVCVLSHVQLFAPLWTVAHQAPLSMGFPRQESWSRLPFPSPGDLPMPGVKPSSLMSPALAGRFFTTSATWEAKTLTFLIEGEMCMRAETLQSCPTLCDSMDCSQSGSSVHGILQARILEWVAMLFSRESSRPRDWTRISYVSCIARQVLYHHHHFENGFNLKCSIAFCWMVFPQFCRCN